MLLHSLNKCQPIISTTNDHLLSLTNKKYPNNKTDMGGEWHVSQVMFKIPTLLCKSLLAHLDVCKVLSPCIKPVRFSFVLTQLPNQSFFYILQ